MIYILIGYWFIFYHKYILNPFRLSYGDNLYLFFPSERLCGEYWRKCQIPKDDYYYEDVLGVKTGVLYPVNILFSIIESILPLDTAFIVHVWNILLHSLATSLIAYYLFGQGLVGLFGALAWGYYAYHIKQDLFYVQAFTWITATLYCVHHNLWLYAGASFGMLILSGIPTLTMYFLFLTFHFPFYLIYTTKQDCAQRLPHGGSFN
jgi:hypothetical protein